MIRVFNYPWSGRLGRVAGKCLCCGTTGMSFQLSSFAMHCLDCRKAGKEPDPKLLAAHEDECYDLTRKWCLERGINYEATVDAYHAQFGEISQENPPRVQQPGEDYTVYLPSKESP